LRPWWVKAYHGEFGKGFAVEAIVEGKELVSSLQGVRANHEAALSRALCRWHASPQTGNARLRPFVFPSRLWGGLLRAAPAGGQQEPAS
jgi:hypothetical protein